MTRPVDLVLARLDKPRPNGRDRWRARCPAHDGGNPSSLSVGVGHDDAVLLKCWVGCDVSQVAHAIGLEIADLFPPSLMGGAPSLKRRALLSARQAIDVIEFEALLVGVAAFNLANGHALTEEDLHRLSVAGERIQAVIAEVRA